jgi:hypothetical protein
MRLAELAPEALVLADAVCAGDMEAETRARQVLIARHDVLAARFAGRFSDRNTASAGLSEALLNQFRDNRDY